MESRMEQTEAGKRSYRCTYHPKDQEGRPVASDSGALPSIRVKANSANQAELLAWATTGCNVASVERLEECEVGA